MKKLLLFLVVAVLCSCSVKTYNVKAIREDNLEIDYYSGKEYLCSVIGDTEVDVSVSVDKFKKNMVVVFNAINGTGEKVTFSPDKIRYFFKDSETSSPREMVAYTAEGYTKYLEKRAKKTNLWGVVFAGVDAYTDATSETTTYGWVTDSLGNVSYHQNTVKEVDPVASKLLFATYCNRVHSNYLDDLKNIKDISQMLLRKHTLRPGKDVTGIVVLDVRKVKLEDEIITISAPLGENVHEFSYTIKKEKL